LILGLVGGAFGGLLRPVKKWQVNMKNKTHHARIWTANPLITN